MDGSLIEILLIGFIAVLFLFFFPSEIPPSANKQLDCSKVFGIGQDRRHNKSKLKVTIFNLYWLFDGVDDPVISPTNKRGQKYATNHINEMGKIIHKLDSDIVILSEVEDCTTAGLLLKSIPANHRTDYKIYLVRGTDHFTNQNVALLTKIDPIAGIFRGVKKVSKHFYANFDINLGTQKMNLSIIAAHLIAHPNDKRRIEKRESQAALLSELGKRLLKGGSELIIGGDLNDYSNSVLDVKNSIPTSSVMKILSSADTPEMFQPSSLLSKQDRYSHRTGTLIDHYLISEKLKTLLTNISINHNDVKNVKEGGSDHYPVTIVFERTFFLVVPLLVSSNQQKYSYETERDSVVIIYSTVRTLINLYDVLLFFGQDMEGQCEFKFTQEQGVKDKSDFHSVIDDCRESFTDEFSVYEPEEIYEKTAINKSVGMKILLVTLFVILLLIVSVSTSATMMAGSQSNFDTLSDSSEQSVDIVVRRLASNMAESVADGISDFTTTPLLILANSAEKLKETDWSENDVHDKNILSIILGIVVAYQRHPKLDGTVSAYITAVPRNSSNYIHLAGMATPHGWAGGSEIFLWGESNHLSDPAFKLVMHPRNSSSIDNWKSNFPITMFQEWSVTEKRWFTDTMERPKQQLSDVTWASVFFQDCIMKLVQPMVQPIMYADGNGIKYILVIDIEVEYFSKFLRIQTKSISANSKAVIVESKSGLEIAHSLLNYDPCILELSPAANSPDPHIRHAVKTISSNVPWMSADGFSQNSIVFCPRGCWAEYSRPFRTIRDCGFNVGDADGDTDSDGDGDNNEREVEILASDGTDGDGNTGDTDGDGNTGDTDGDGNTGDTDGDGNTGDTDGDGNTGDTDGDGNTGDTDGDGDADADTDGTNGKDNSKDAIYGIENTALIGPQSEQVLIRASKVSDSFGLDWTTVLIIPQGDFYSEIKRSQTQAQDKMDEVSLISISVAVGALLGAVAAVLFVTNRIAKPIHNLMDEMSRVAVMELENIDEPPLSVISEINSMQASFLVMVGHLKALRAFLPESVLAAGIQEPPIGSIGIVFTDIVSSTLLWDRSPTAMDVCLGIHNSEIRIGIIKYSGYEVKTIGDAFFVAFADVENAARFALETHERLVDSEWDPELGLPPVVEKGTSNTLWNGLVVRVGLTYGEVISEKNPLTGRGDYRGTPVNIGSRLEAASKHGCVCMDGRTFAVISKKIKVQSIKDLRTFLKGLSGTFDIFQVSLPRLAKRLTDNPVAHDGTRNDRVDISLKLGALGVRSPPDPNKHKVFSKSSFSSQLSRSARPRRHELPEKASDLSIAVVRAVGRIDGVVNILSAIITASGEIAHQTGGVIEHVHNRLVILSWNASKCCCSHRTSCLLFAQKLQQKLSNAATVGICSGTTKHGIVGSLRQKFYSVVGASLELATSVAEYSSTLHCFALHAEVEDEIKCPFTATFLVPIDRWRIDGIGEVTINYINFSRVAASESDKSRSEEIELSQYVETFEKMMSGGPLVLPPYIEGITRELIENNLLLMTTTDSSHGCRIHSSPLSLLPSEIAADAPSALVAKVTSGKTLQLSCYID